MASFRALVLMGCLAGLPLTLFAQGAEDGSIRLPWLPHSVAAPEKTATPAPSTPTPPAEARTAAPAAQETAPVASPVEPVVEVAAPAPSPAPASPAADTASKSGSAAAPQSASDGTGAKTEAAAAPAAKPEPVPAKKLFGAAKIAAANLTPRAIGSYAKGCLAGGKALAIDGPAWQAMRLSRNRNWGHPKLINLLERFATEMKTKENWPGLLIGDLAQPRGGPMLTGHKSHQVGLDADIWFKPMPSRTIPVAERETFEPLLLAEDNGKEVIAANWNDGFARLVKRAASYPEVERIFVHPAIKKKFCEVAGEDKAWLAKVRPMWLHNYHFHVRIGCPSNSTTCETQKAILGDDGCGKEIEDWIKLVSRPAKPAPPAPKPDKPVKPPAPKPEITLDQLPPECRAVLTADPGGQEAPPPVVAAHAGKSKADKTAAKKKTAAHD